MRFYVLVQETIDHFNQQASGLSSGLAVADSIATDVKKTLALLLSPKAEVEKLWNQKVAEFTQDEESALPVYTKLPNWFRENLVGIGENSDLYHFDKHPDNEKLCVCFEIDDDLMRYLDASERKAAKDDLYKLVIAVTNACYLKVQKQGNK